MKYLTFVFVILLSFPLSGNDLSRPNIVLIMVDDLGAEALACYGNITNTTPNIDRMAQYGAVYNNAYAAPSCTPTRAMILTGLFPNRSGFLERLGLSESRLPTHLTTFGQVFQSAGYATCISGKWHLGEFDRHPDQPTSHGFDEHCMHTHVWKGKRTSFYYAPDNWENGKHVTYGQDMFGPDIYCDYIIDFIERHKEVPFLAYYPMTLVHTPLVTPPALKDLAYSKFPDDLPQNERIFGHMLTYADMLLGRILDKLDELGLTDNTLVIFTGDNGCAPSNTSYLEDMSLRGGKLTMTEAGMRVPFIAQWQKGVPAGERKELISLMDMQPTLAGVAKIELKHEVDGMDLSHTLFQSAGKDRDYISMACEGGLYLIRNKRFLLHQDGRMYDIPNTSNITRYGETLCEDTLNATDRAHLQAFLDDYMKIYQTDTSYYVVPFSVYRKNRHKKKE